MTQPPYVSRPEAEEFLEALGKALKAPAENPVVFHVWGIGGIGGIGKSTLLGKVIEEFPNAAYPLVGDQPIKFGQTEEIENPANLMRKLHSLLQPKFLDPSFFGQSLRKKPDLFLERYTQYSDAINELQTVAPDGKTGASEEQIGLVKQLVKALTQGAGALATVAGNPIAGGALTAASQGTDAVVDAASLALSEKDRIQNLVQSHKATREQRDLQDLLLNPLPKLTEAFVETLRQWSEQKPILLLLDTYEKADLSTIDTWLWRTLLSNTSIRRYPIRLLIAGRYNLLNRQDWATVQQNGELVKPFGPPKFTPEQTQEYLEAINITDAATIQQIHRITQGWPYYLNKIREKPQAITPDSLAQGLAEFLVNHLPDAEQPRAKRLAQLAACCLSFNSQMIYFLAQQLQLEPPSPRNIQVQVAPSCFDWLTEQTFVEPVSGSQWRVDDVARDVFRASLWQEDQALFERIHDLLARYFKAISDQAVAPTTPTSEKYENPDWRKPRAKYLYHLLFTRQANLQTIWQSHLLEATYLRQGEMLQSPLQAVVAEHPLTNHPYLAYTTRSFLGKISPAVEYGWAVLEEDPIDYAYNETELGLSKSQTDTAIEACLSNPEALEGVAQFAALFYRSKRCLKAKKQNYLSQAKQQAALLADTQTQGFLTDLYLYQLGNSFYKIELFEEAIAAYDQALAIKPDDPEALYNKGTALAELGRTEEAIAAYDAALSIKPDFHNALNNKGIALRQLGRTEEAIAAYDAALSIKADKHEAWYNRGLALKNLERYEEALASWDRALEFNPTDADAWNWRGRMFEQLGNTDEAIANYRKAIELDSGNFWPWKNLGGLFDELGQPEESIAHYKQALEIRSEDSDTWEYLGLSYLHARQFASAIESFNKAIELAPEDGSPVYNKACCYGLQENVEKAIECLQAAIALDPENLELAKTDADFAPIRHDERFRALVEGGG